MKCPSSFLAISPPATLFLAACGERTCPTCGHEFWLPRVQADFLAGLVGAEGDARSITLTAPARVPLGWNTRGLASAWNRLLPGLKRVSPGMQYIKVIEFQKRGALHTHVVTRGLRISRTELVERAVRAGFGRMLEIKPVTGAEGLWSHLSKYALDHRYRPRQRVFTKSRLWVPRSTEAIPRERKPFAKVNHDFGRSEVSWRLDGKKQSIPLSVAQPLIDCMDERAAHGRRPSVLIPESAIRTETDERDAA